MKKYKKVGLFSFYTNQKRPKEYRELAQKDYIVRWALSGYNYGNYFFSDAIFKQVNGLEEVYPSHPTPHYKTDAHRVLNLSENEDIKTYLKKTADDFNNSDNEALVIANANQFNEDFDLTIFADFLEEIKKPLIPIGLGAQFHSHYYSKEDFCLPKGSVRFFKILQEKSKAIGVRGQYTQEVLAKHGIKNTVVIGCPTNFWKLDRNLQITKKDKLPKDCSLLVHSGSGDYILNKIFNIMEANKKASYLIQAEVDLIQALEGNVSWKDTTLAKHNQALADRFTNDNLLAKEQVKDFWDWDLTKEKEFVSKKDFAIGSRFHGNMIALHHGTPALWAVIDTRVREFVEYLNLPYVFWDEFNKLSLDEMWERADYSLFNKTYKSKYDRYRDFLELCGLSHNLSSESEGNKTQELLYKDLPFKTSIENKVLIKTIESVFKDSNQETTKGSYYLLNNILNSKTQAEIKQKVHSPRFSFKWFLKRRLLCLFIPSKKLRQAIRNS